MVKKTKPEVRRASAKPVSEADAQLVPQQKIEIPKIEPAACVEFDIGGGGSVVITHGENRRVYLHD
jgi:hypothetical protein